MLNIDVLALNYCLLLCVGRDLDGTAQCLKGVENEKEELNSLTTVLQKSLEVLGNNQFKI